MTKTRLKDCIFRADWIPLRCFLMYEAESRFYKSKLSIICHTKHDQKLIGCICRRFAVALSISDKNYATISAIPYTGGKSGPFIVSFLIYECRYTDISWPKSIRLQKIFTLDSLPLIHDWSTWLVYMWLTLQYVTNLCPSNFFSNGAQMAVSSSAQQVQQC